MLFDCPSRKTKKSKQLLETYRAALSARHSTKQALLADLREKFKQRKIAPREYFEAIYLQVGEVAGESSLRNDTYTLSNACSPLYNCQVSQRILRPM